jgi:hypothetical protein
MSDRRLDQRIDELREANRRASEERARREAAEELQRAQQEEEARALREQAERRREETVASFFERVRAAGIQPSEVEQCGPVEQVGRWPKRRFERPKRRGWILTPFRSASWDGGLASEADPGKTGVILLEDGTVHELKPCMEPTPVVISEDRLVDLLARFLVARER